MYQKKQGYKRRRGLFPWRPRFPSRATTAWDAWYRSWIVDAPYQAKAIKE